VRDSTSSNTTVKPTKPYPDFPLYAHASGRWAKKIRQKLYYFGPWRDPRAALELYLDQRDDLYAGRTPRSLQDSSLLLGELCARYLLAKTALVENGELSRRTLRNYTKTCDSMVEFFGPRRVVHEMRPSDFGPFRISLSRGRGPVTLGNTIQKIRSVFKWAYDEGLIDNPVRFGGFKKPSTRTVRKEQARFGRRDFSADQVQSFLSHAPDQLKAMILLGVNCGFGQTDCSSLVMDAVDLERGWHTFGRPKTGIPRRCPLWPETIEALRDVISRRGDAKSTEDADCVFLTKYGQRWVRVYEKGTHDDAVAKEFKKLQQQCDLVRARVGFYSLRRTFETVGGNCRDQVAVDFLMGHAPGANDMAAVYRQDISDDRLLGVTNHIHAWLHAEPASK